MSSPPPGRSRTGRRTGAQPPEPLFTTAHGAVQELVTRTTTSPSWPRCRRGPPPGDLLARPGVEPTNLGKYLGTLQQLRIVEGPLRDGTSRDARRVCTPSVTASCASGSASSPHPGGAEEGSTRSSCTARSSSPICRASSRPCSRTLAGMVGARRPGGPRVGRGGPCRAFAAQDRSPDVGGDRRGSVSRPDGSAVGECRWRAIRWSPDPEELQASSCRLSPRAGRQHRTHVGSCSSPGEGSPTPDRGRAPARHPAGDGGGVVEGLARRRRAEVDRDSPPLSSR